MPVTFQLERSEYEIYTSYAGLTFLAKILKAVKLKKVLNKLCGKTQGTRHYDTVACYLGLLLQSKTDFEAIENYRNDKFFKKALGLERVPSCATLRQRLDKYAGQYEEAIKLVNIEFLKIFKVPLVALSSGHLVFDIDVFVLNNHDSKKEGVSRTYHTNVDGFAPIGGYLGKDNGWCIEAELRPGSQHSQKEFLPYLKRSIVGIRQITKKKLLIRIDSAHDAAENRAFFEANKDHLDYICKFNPRHEKNKGEYWFYMAEKDKDTIWEKPREGKEVGIFINKKHYEFENEMFEWTRVIKVTKRSIDKNGQYLLPAEYEYEAWWTSLDIDPTEVIQLYNEHGTSEQFHSEFKTDMDVERLPSGKFATNSAVFSMAGFAYNILRYLGQELLEPNAPRRGKVKRRRIKTIMQELISVACRFIRTARKNVIRFAQNCPVFDTFEKLYDKILEFT